MALSLTDALLKTVMQSAPSLPVEKRDLYLQRIAAMLQLKRVGSGYRDADVSDVDELALHGLIQQIDAA